MKARCGWCGTDPTYIAYHDDEWGVPVRDDRRLFEFLVLEGAQAGLSWITILRKRDAYRAAYAGFDAGKVARFDRRKVERLLANPGIVRNRLKVESSIRNARAFLKVQEEFGSFDAYQWRFVGGRPVQNSWASLKRIPPRTAVSDALSRDLKQRGFSFVGSTIVYAHMQAVGMVNDHIAVCFRRREVARLRWTGLDPTYGPRDPDGLRPGVERTGRDGQPLTDPPDRPFLANRLTDPSPG